MPPLVSIIISTKNEEKHIERCLHSIQNQSYPKDQIEIIVVDNASNDKTQQLAQKYTDKIFDKGPERSAQRNYGVKQALGEYIIYLDADMVLSEDVILECVSKVQKDPEIVALYVSEIVMGQKYFSRVRRFERYFYDGTVIDCVRFIRRKIFLELGGFDESLTGPEDWDLDKRIRMAGKVDLATKPIYHNETEFNLRKYLSKKSYYAKNFDLYIKKWGENDPEIRKQFGVWYRFFGVFLENGKWKKFLGNPPLMAGLFFLRFLVGLDYISRKKH